MVECSPVGLPFCLRAFSTRLKDDVVAGASTPGVFAGLSGANKVSVSAGEGMGVSHPEMHSLSRSLAHLLSCSHSPAYVWTC